MQLSFARFLQGGTWKAPSGWHLQILTLENDIVATWEAGGFFFCGEDAEASPRRKRLGYVLRGTWKQREFPGADKGRLLSTIGARLAYFFSKAKYSGTARTAP